MGQSARGVVVLIVAGCVAPAVGAAAPPDIRGFWEHDACVVQEREGRRTGSRSAFAFFDREWGLVFTQYADEDCRVRVSTAVMRGTYESTGPSTSVPGAYETTFRFSYRGLVVFDEVLLATVRASCEPGSWKLEEEREVTARGCLWLESLEACAQEYDLVAVDGRSLRLGERPLAGRNLCAPERRPTRVRAVPLARRR